MSDTSTIPANQLPDGAQGAETVDYVSQRRHEMSEQTFKVGDTVRIAGFLEEMVPRALELKLELREAGKVMRIAANSTWPIRVEFKDGILWNFKAEQLVHATREMNASIDASAGSPSQDKTYTASVETRHSPEIAPTSAAVTVTVSEAFARKLWMWGELRYYGELVESIHEYVDGTFDVGLGGDWRIMNASGEMGYTPHAVTVDLRDDHAKLQARVAALESEVAALRKLLSQREGDGR